MSRKDPVNWMLSEAIDSLARAERLRQQFFRLQGAAGSQESSWEPPIDVLETDEEILIFEIGRASCRERVLMPV